MYILIISVNMNNIDVCIIGHFNNFLNFIFIFPYNISFFIELLFNTV